MERAAALFVGTHDFVHLCKPDPSRPDMTTERTVLSTGIVAVQDTGLGARAGLLLLSQVSDGHAVFSHQGQGVPVAPG